MEKNNKKLVEQFNKKHNLTNIDNNMFVTHKFDPDKTADLSGKLTTTTKEVIKRFFMSPINIVAAIVLFGIILLAAIVTYTSMYNPQNPISGVQRSIIANLPPRTFGEFVNQNLTNTQLLSLQQAGF
jgi:hypothetical protein